MFKFLKKLWRDQRGNALVIAAAALPLVIGSAGLATDTIQWVLWRRQLQRLADSGAIAGVYARVSGQSAGSCANIASATYTDPVAYHIRNNNGLAVTPTCTMTFPNIPNTSNDVRVVLSMSQPLAFSGFFTNSTPVITASATAATTQTGVYCVVSLENTNATGITAIGNSNIDLGCGMITNSTSLNAAIATGSSSVHATPVAAVGDIQDSSHWNDAELLPFTVAEADPFAGVPAPSNFPSGSCPTFRVNANVTQTTLTDGVDYAATSDGYYCMRDMTLNGNVTLPDGVYVIDGGDLSVGSQANVTCLHCTFILTNRNSGSPVTIGNANINGGAQLNMGPSSGGTYNNMLMYQDRRASSGSSQNNIINGNSASVFAGAMYFPTRTLEINGTSGLNFTCGQFVARNVVFSGNGSVNNSCSGGYGSNTIWGAHVRLVA